MVLVANGGLGSAFDELELNRILCQHYNVRIAGGKIVPLSPWRHVNPWITRVPVSQLYSEF
jgi:hypothetical protein